MKNFIIILSVVLFSTVTSKSWAASVTAGFTFSQTTTGAAEVTFVNTSTGANLKYLWTFGDGNTSMLKDPIHKYQTNNEFKVCLEVTDISTGLKDYICQFVTVNVGAPPCVASFAPQFDVTGLGVTFNNASTGLGTHKYNWNFGNGKTSESASPYLIYDSPGEYNVCLDMTISENGCNNVKCMPIFVTGGTIGVVYAKFSFAKNDLVFTFNNESKPINGKFNWNFGDGTYSNLMNPSHTYKDAGQYQVCLTVDDAQTGKTHQQCQLIQAGAVKECNADFSYLIDETKMQVTFKNMSSGAYTGTYWNFGDGEYSSLAEVVHTYNPESYRACLNIEDKFSGCTDQICKDFTIGKTINCIAGFTFIIDNATRKTTFTNTSNKASVKCLWEFGDGNTSAAFSPINTFKADGLYNVTLNIYDSVSGCQSKYTTQLQIGSNILKPDFTYIVKDSLVSFADNTLGTIGNWYWTFGNGATSKERNPSVVYKENGVYNVCLTNTETITGKQYNICKDVQIGTSPLLADFSFVVDKITRMVYFTDLSKGGATGWSWNFGDGYTDKINNPKHVFEKENVYRVCLSVFNSQTGKQAQICKDISVINSTSICKADFTYTIDANDSITFTDASQGNIANWYWVLGNGDYAKTSSFKYKYSKEGIYRVCLFAGDNATCKSEVCKEIILSTNPCQAAFTSFVNDSLKEITLTSKAIGDIASYYWDFGDGTSSAKINTKHVYVNAGSYKVTLSIKSSDGTCFDSYTEEIQVGGATCKANFDFSINTTGNVVSFNNTSSGTIEKVFWKFSNGMFSDEQNPIIKFDKSGQYYASLIIAGPTCNGSVEKAVQVGTVNCGAQFKLFVDSLSNTVYFNNNVLGASTNLYWEFGDGSTSTGQNPKHLYTSPGYYKVTLKTMDKLSGCMDANTQLVLIGSQGQDCQADFVFQVDQTTRALSCYDKSLADKNRTYMWNFGERSSVGATTANPTYTYKNDGYYNVCLTISDAVSGCKNTKCEYIQVGKDTTQCLAKFIYTIDSVNKTVYFTDQSAGKPTTWNWYFGDNATSTLQNPSHTYTDTGYYKVYVVISNPQSNCKSDFVNVINVNTGRTKVKASYNYTLLAQNKGVMPVEFKGAAYGDPDEFEWDFGDGETDNSTMSPVHEYAEPSTYQACFTAYNILKNEFDTYCLTIDLTLTGMQNKEVSSQNSEGFEMWPNPIQSKAQSLTLRLAQGDKNVYVSSSVGTANVSRTDDVNTSRYSSLHSPLDVTITNTLGQVVLSYDLRLSTDYFSLDVSQFNPGIYFVKIGSSVKKLIIE